MKDNSTFKNELIKRSLSFGISVIRFTNILPKERAYWIIADQVIRSSTSIGANIVEAQAASSKKDFINFLLYALKSGNETKYWLMLIKGIDQGLSGNIDSLYQEADELVKILGSSVSKLKGRRKETNF